MSNENFFMKIPVLFLRSYHKGMWSTSLALFLLVGGSHPAFGQSQQELLFFTSVDAFENTSGTTPNVEDSFVRPAVDVLYSYSGDKFRFLGEYLWSSEESELERFKAGWQLSGNTMFWLGRYHSTAKFWTSEYHHGQFLQTSITRPSVDLWEDESGPMPSHITGFSLEHESTSANESAIDYAFSVGLGPQFEGQQLVPFDLLDPGSGHDAAFNYRMVYRPSIISPNQFGLATAWNEINVISESNPALADLNHIRQVTIGVFADWSWDKWRLLANIIYFNNDMQHVDESQKDEFVAGYVQAEFELSQSWTIFARVDSAFNEDDSPYLRLLPGFIAHRNMIGARWDFAGFQSFTMEIADTSVQGDGLSHNRFKEVRVQWSAVFP
jgi:hypothetical protein